MSKQSLGEILAEQLDAIEEVGGPERHLLVQTIGRDAYDALISKAKGANLLDRWLNATGKAKGLATRALALHIARVADRADLAGRIEREINDAFDDGSSLERGDGAKRSPTRRQVTKHADAVNQRRQGQRSEYKKPNGVSVTMLAELAKSSDASKYIKARENSRH